MSLDDYARPGSAASVREVEVDGRILITTLLDTKVTPRELDALYALRWNIKWTGERSR
ncbi:MAG: hypothetical protein IPJ50_01045 [Betaproteobacteria bacterium]|nr:hypothetical protein [Betaproteobacteria bacterium]